MFNQEPNKRGLGRGLSSLLGETNISTERVMPPQPSAPTQNQQIKNTSPFHLMAIEKLYKNKFQPREKFDALKLKELADSIREHGIMQPIVVRKQNKPDGSVAYEIIAGERRWRAAQQAGLKEVPVMIKTEVTDQKSLELALIENIQRHELNVVEEAEAFQKLNSQFGLTHEAIAKSVGKDRATITNALRLLQLCKEVRELLKEQKISTGHAKVILAITAPEKQREIASQVIAQKLSVRATEKLVAQSLSDKVLPPQGAAQAQTIIANRLAKGLEQTLAKSLATKVAVEYVAGKGKLTIQFYSDEQLNQLVERLK